MLHGLIQNLASICAQRREPRRGVAADAELRVFWQCPLRRSNQRVNRPSLGPYAIKGGHMFYFAEQRPQKKNLIAYNNRLSVLSGAGVETVLTSGLSANKNVFMSTWSIKSGRTSRTRRTHCRTMMELRTRLCLGQTSPSSVRPLCRYETGCWASRTTALSVQIPRSGYRGVAIVAGRPYGRVSKDPSRRCIQRPSRPQTRSLDGAIALQGRAYHH